MATITFEGNNLSASFGNVAMCSGLTVGATPTNEAMDLNGASGVNISFTAAGSVTNSALVFFQTSAVGLQQWKSGTYTLTMVFTVANTNLTWTKVFICRASSGGSSLATIGSNTAVGLTCTGTCAPTVSGAAQSASNTDVIYVVCAFTNSKGSSQSASFGSGVSLATPIDTVDTVMGSMDTGSDLFIDRQRRYFFFDAIRRAQNALGGDAWAGKIDPPVASLPTQPLTEYPAPIDRRFFHARQQPYYSEPWPLIAATQKRTVEWLPMYVDRPDKPIDKKSFQARQQQFFATSTGQPSPDTEKFPMEWQPRYEDRVPKLELKQFHASKQPYFSDPWPLSAIAQTRTIPWLPWYQDMVKRPVYQVTEQDAFEMHPNPIAGVPTQFPVSYPDLVSVNRPVTWTANQPFLAAENIVPERTFVAFDPEYPDDVRRPKYLAAHQPFFAEVRARDEAVSLIETGHDVEPARVIRPTYPAHNQLAFTTSQQPERTFPAFDPEYPDDVRRPKLHASNQPYVTGEYPQPEVTVDEDWQPVFQERVTRPAYASNKQPFFTTSAQPEMTVAPSDVRYVDRHVEVRREVGLRVSLQQFATFERPRDEAVSFLEAGHDIAPARAVRPVYQTHMQPFFTTSPSPERTLPMADVRHPDRVDRPYLRAEQQLATTEISPRPDDKISMDWQGTAPDRIIRPTFPATIQPYFTGDPRPLVPPTQFPWSYTDRLIDVRREIGLRVSLQQEVTKLSPNPIPLPQPGIGYGWQPDRTIRRSVNDGTFHSARQPFFASNLVPEDKFVRDWAGGWQPDRVDRPAYHAARQPYFVTDQKPEEKLPEDFYVLFPDRVLRPVFQASQQERFGLNVLPIINVPFNAAEYPSRVIRPMFRTENQQATVGSPQPEIPLAFYDAQYPAHPERLAFRVERQLAVTEVYPQPEIKVAEDWQPIYPERPIRPITPVSEQTYAGVLWPVPEGKVPLDWHPDYQDRVRRLTFSVTEQQAFAARVAPEREAPLADVSFPVMVERPSFTASLQQAHARYEKPIAPDTTDVFQIRPIAPERVRRPWFDIQYQQSVIYQPPPPPFIDAYKRIHAKSDNGQLHIDDNGARINVNDAGFVTVAINNGSRIIINN